MAKKQGTMIFVWVSVGILTFGAFGFGASGLSGRVSSIGTVGDLPIPVNSYAAELRAQIAERSAQEGRTLSFAQAEDLRLPDAALSQVTAQRVLDLEMTRLGISVGDERVREEILATPSFRGADGTFDRDRYRTLLDSNGLSEREYETAIREDTARSLLQVALLTGISGPDIYAETLAGYIGERRDFTWASLRPEALDEPLPAPTDAELQAHYEANPDDFTAPETRSLTYAWITPAMIQDQVTVDEAELRAAYEERLDEFVQPERRLVERLVFSNVENAQAALDRIEAGEIDFDALVRERGLDLSDIDLGDVSERDLGAAGEAVFATETGDVVGPFDTTLGPALFRMNAILMAQEVTFEEAIPELRESRAAARAGRVIEDQQEPLTDLLAGGARLEDLVERSDMVLGQMDWTPDTRGEIADYAAFREAVEDLQPDTFPTLLSLEDGGLFAVRVDELRPPELRPFDEVREEVRAGWLAAETRARLIARAEEIAATITPETDFTDLGLEDAIQDTGLTRRDFLAGTPPNFMTEVFRLEDGETTTVEAAEVVLIVRVDAISAPPEGDAMVTAEMAAITRNAGESIAADLFSYFRQTLLSTAPIDINQSAVNAVHANFR